MASFIRRLFGGGGEEAQAPAPQAPAAPAVTPAVKAEAASKLGKAIRGSKTIYTGPGGLSVEEKSKRALKYLTGQ